MRADLFSLCVCALLAASTGCGNGVPTTSLPGGSGGTGDSCLTNADCATATLCVRGQCAAIHSGQEDGGDAGQPPVPDGGFSHDGLPCDVAALLSARCNTCHSSPPTQGAPVSLLSYSDLMAPSLHDTTKNEAQVSLQRMQATNSPMPPGVHLPGSEIAVLQGWLNGGAPSGTCIPVVPDGGPAPDAGPIPDGGTIPSGLPCDVSNLLQTSCTSCHSNPPSGGATMSLLTYADLMATSPTNPSNTEAQQSVVRMTSASAPMPASGLLPASQAAILQNWINSGAPQGTCQPTVPDGGLPDTPPQCSSNIFWTGGENSSMRPGEACIACHSRELEAPQYAVAGTVYPTVHEPNDCNGGGSVLAGSKVIVRDSAGHTLTLTPNSVGNFFSLTRLTPPIYASVQRNGLTRAMVASPTTGDCNSCHTQSGALSAPGRIVPP